jgi:molybdopterin-guanine dinucleotide biosynthesis protein A
LFAVYRRTCLAAIAACLDAGDHRMFSFFAAVRTRYVKPDDLRVLDPDLRSFFNVNTPDDWRAAQQLAGAG